MEEEEKEEEEEEEKTPTVLPLQAAINTQHLTSPRLASPRLTVPLPSQTATRQDTEGMQTLC
ncbi:hypothetical protein E2C01_036824 [Portunus trituberculatus]|uniref:Uncharacterized protein n=1 Tax=Portunus trituberculatus TaxID=210409 RepID=A0A5B7FFE3_PORTR|nr:hypothetical protein [Portunus trituberculatus]